jgi:hypothetical protein
VTFLSLPFASSESSSHVSMNLLFWESFVARAGRTVRQRSQAELMTVLREKPLSLGNIGLVLFGLSLLDEFGNIR